MIVDDLTIALWASVLSEARTRIDEAFQDIAEGR